MVVHVGTWVAAAALDDNLTALLLVFSGYLQTYCQMFEMRPTRLSDVALTSHI